MATKLVEANISTLLLEGGGLSYGITGGNLSSRRPDWLDGTSLTRVDVPGLYKSIFTDGDDLVCDGSVVAAYGGCTLGGSSAINAGLFFEPPASDWDTYFPGGWKSVNMSHAIDRLYARQPNTNLTSTDGKRYLQSGYDIAREWIVDNLGFKNVDINAQADKKLEVFGYPIFDYFNGQRGGPVVTYLQSALNHSNFHLETSAQVSRIERANGTATGVIVRINNTERFIPLTPRGRVILSGGAIQSPSVLYNSGIGPTDILTSLMNSGNLSIPSTSWIQNNAVGAYLFDNPNTFIELESVIVDSYVYSYDTPLQSDEDLYLTARSGPYTFASETSVFWDSQTRSDGSVVSFQGTIDSSGYADFLSNNTITLNIYGTSGLKSRGSVTVDMTTGVPGVSGDVYYSVPSDGEEIAGFIQKIFAGLPLTLSPLNIARNATIEEITTYITTPSAYAKGMVNHWSSSCRIGECVDAETRVVGTQNIHVVDASILEPLTVNPQFGVMAAAERASEILVDLIEGF